MKPVDEKKAAAVVLSVVGTFGLIGFSLAGIVYMAMLSCLLLAASVLLGLSVLKGEGVVIFPPKTNGLRVRGSNRERAYLRVQNTINNGKVTVSVEDDGIYIRLAGDENRGEAFSEKKVKVYDYEI